MREQNITEHEQMTPDHAHAVLKQLRNRKTPAYGYIREFIRLRLFYRPRTSGRGGE
jgi:hypothetical protein